MRTRGTSNYSSKILITEYPKSGIVFFLIQDGIRFTGAQAKKNKLTLGQVGRSGSGSVGGLGQDMLGFRMFWSSAQVAPEERRGEEKGTEK